jgi:hypothetical protein
MKTKTTLLGCLLALAAWSSQAFQITNLSPQGEVARVRQVLAKFDDSAMAFGDPKAEAPLGLSCSDAQASQGAGRWVNDRAWALTFENDLPPGVSCTLQARAGIKSAKGVALTGPSSYRFSTGGPFVQSVRPYQGEPIDGEQFFAMRLLQGQARAGVTQGAGRQTPGVGQDKFQAGVWRRRQRCAR